MLRPFARRWGNVARDPQPWQSPARTPKRVPRGALRAAFSSLSCACPRSGRVTVLGGKAPSSESARNPQETVPPQGHGGGNYTQDRKLSASDEVGSSMTGRFPSPRGNRTLSPSEIIAAASVTTQARPPTDSPRDFPGAPWPVSAHRLARFAAPSTALSSPAGSPDRPP